MNKELFIKLLNTPSPSGFEYNIQKLLNEELAPYRDQLLTHHSYNCCHVLNPESNVKVLLLAHVDEIGLIIERVLDNGICKLTNIGSIRPEMYMGQHVNVVKFNDNEISYIPGVIGYTTNYEKGHIEVEELNLDLGFKSKEEALKHISIGDPVLYQNKVDFLENNLISSRALDNKISVFILTEVLKRLKGNTTNGVYVCPTVGEETTKRGAIFAAKMVNPTLSITLDVGSSSDVKCRNNENREVSLGDGPILTISSYGNHILHKMLKDTCLNHNIKHQTVLEISKTWTDFDEVYKQNDGIPSELISIPLRYMHSNVEVGSLDDVLYTIELLVEFIKGLTESDSFNRFEK